MMDAQRTTNSLVFVHPDDIHAYWPYVAPRLIKLKHKIKARWIPEDVYRELKNATASLHIAEDGDQYLGFVILQPGKDFDGKSLWVWIAYSDGIVDVVEKYEPQFTGYARNIGAKRLMASSPRKLERRLKSFGWVEAHAVFEKEV
jgi:hypothetical protein